MLYGLLFLAILAFLALLGAKIYQDNKKAAEAVREHDPERAKRITRELLTATQGQAVLGRVVDTSGRAGIALVDGDRLVVVRASWSARPSSKKSSETVPTSPMAGVDVRMVDAGQLVDVKLHELFSSKTSKDGSTETRIGGVELLLFLDDMENPVVVVDFLAKDVRSGSPEHEAARTEALLWEGRMRALAFRGQRSMVAKSQLAALQGRARSA